MADLRSLDDSMPESHGPEPLLECIIRLGRPLCTAGVRILIELPA